MPLVSGRAPVADGAIIVRIRLVRSSEQPDLADEGKPYPCRRAFPLTIKMTFQKTLNHLSHILKQVETIGHRASVCVERSGNRSTG